MGGAYPPCLLMKVREAMARGADTVRLDCTLREVHAVFARGQADVVAVVGRDESGWMRRVIGVITRADLLRCLMSAKTGRALTLLRTKTVAEVMRRVKPLRPSDTMADATRRILESGLAALPVVEADGRLSGMLSLGDVFARPLAPSHSAAV